METYFFGLSLGFSILCLFSKASERGWFFFGLWALPWSLNFLILKKYYGLGEVEWVFLSLKDYP